MDTAIRIHTRPYFWQIFHGRYKLRKSKSLCAETSERSCKMHCTDCFEWRRKLFCFISHIQTRGQGTVRTETRGSFHLLLDQNRPRNSCLGDNNQIKSSEITAGGTGVEPSIPAALHLPWAHCHSAV